MLKRARLQPSPHLTRGALGRSNDASLYAGDSGAVFGCVAPIPLAHGEAGCASEEACSARGQCTIVQAPLHPYAYPVQAGRAGA